MVVAAAETEEEVLLSELEEAALKELAEELTLPVFALEALSTERAFVEQPAIEKMTVTADSKAVIAYLFFIRVYLH